MEKIPIATPMGAAAIVGADPKAKFRPLGPDLRLQYMQNAGFLPEEVQTIETMRKYASSNKIGANNQINLFSSLIDMATKKVKYETLPLNADAEVYQHRTEKAAVAGVAGRLNLPQAELAVQNNIIEEYKQSYGVTDNDIEVFKNHLDVPNFPISLPDLSIDDVLQQHRIPVAKVIRHPSYLQFFHSITKCAPIENSLVLQPFVSKYNMYGTYKPGKYYATSPMKILINQSAPDSYAKFTGLDHFVFTITLNEEATFTNDYLFKFFQRFKQLTKMDTSAKKERHVMEVVEVDHKVIVSKEDPDVEPSMIVPHYNQPTNSPLELYEKVLISVAQQRVIAGEAARVNIPSQLNGMNNKYSDMPYCEKLHSHDIYVVGGGNFESLMTSKIIRHANKGDIIHLIDPLFMTNGTMDLNGVIVMFYKDDIIEFLSTHDITGACSVYSDIGYGDPHQLIMTNDYYYTNSVTNFMMNDIYSPGVLYHIMLGVSRNMLDYKCDQVLSYTGSPEIFVTILPDGDDSKRQSLYDLLPKIMCQKMKFNNKRIEQFKKGNLVVAKGHRIRYNDNNYYPPILVPTKSRYVAYSKSIHNDRMIADNIRYFNKKTIIIPEEYLELFDVYVKAGSVAAREKILQRVPPDIALLFHQKSMLDIKITSSKMRATLGVKKGKFSPTMDQALAFARHPNFIAKIKGVWTLTISNTTEMLLPPSVIDNIYDRRAQ